MHGSVVRWERIWSVDADLWSIVDSSVMREGGWRQHVLIPSKHHRNWRTGSEINCVLPCHGSSCTAYVVPPNKWPDEVCAAVAKYHLRKETD